MLHSNLQNDRARTLLDNARRVSDQGGISQSLDVALGFLRRRYSIIIFATVVAIAASLTYLRITPPTYTGQTTILFGSPKAQFMQQQSVLAEVPLDNTQIETQMQILRSKAIATTVINKLKLANDPDFKAPAELMISHLPMIGTWLGGRQPEAQIDKDGERATAQTDEIVAAFNARLSSVRLGYSNMIEIGFSASSAIKAAEIANAVASAYIADQMNAKFEANRAATGWLQERLSELGERAVTAERTVDAFKSHNNIVAAGGKLMDDQQVSELNSRLVTVRAQTSDALARFNRLQTILDTNSVSSITIGNLDASGSDALNNPIINSLRTQYLDFARREAEWTVRFGSEHLAVVELRTKMKGLRASILDEVRRLAETSRSELEIARQRQAEIETQLASAVTQSRSTNSAEVTVRELETSAKQYRNLYENFLQRYMGSVQQESFPIAEARIISPASPPRTKSKPKSILILALGTLGGLALGVALGLFRDIVDRVFRTSAQIEAALNLPCLSQVPLLPKPRRARLPFPAGTAPPPRGSDQRIITRDSSIYWAASSRPLSRFAESIRAIKLAIDHNPRRKVIGITSALPNEGKSTISASLAQLIAHAGKRVIIVDCDLRNPSLSANLTPGADAGIIDVLSGAKTLEEAIWTDPKTKLDILPAAKQPPLHHSSELLLAERTKKLFDQLRTAYDYVIVDLPPLAPIIDVRAATHLVDSFVLVVAWGQTKIGIVQQALQYAPNVHEAFIGSVLNKIDMSAMRRYQTYHTEYYSNAHYTRYGLAPGD